MLLTVAFVVSAELHEPPVVGSVSVMAEPTITVVGPVIGAGNGSTVTSAVVKHPVGSVYVIVAVPAATPVDSPVELMVTPDEPDQVPPGGLHVSIVLKPSQTNGFPLIGPGV